MFSGPCQGVRTRHPTQGEGRRGPRLAYLHLLIAVLCKRSLRACECGSLCSAEFGVCAYMRTYMPPCSIDKVGSPVTADPTSGGGLSARKAWTRIR